MNIDNNHTYKVCPLCQNNKIINLGQVRYSQPCYFSSQKVNLKFYPELWNCLNCSSSFIQKAIPEIIAHALYKSSSSNERWMTSSFELSKPIEVVEVFNKLLKSQAKILDIGCNTGEFLDFAKALGCVTSGVEWCSNSLEVMKNKGHQAFCRLDEIKLTDRYDIITAFDLVEHLYDLPDFLKWCKQHLLQDGYLIILTGNILSTMAQLTANKWWYICYPEHIVFPSKYFFEDFSGFQVKQWKHTFSCIQHKKFNCLKKIKSLILGSIKGDYSGFPPLLPDHLLIVLRNNK